MAFRLSPKDDGFYDLFARVADEIVAAANELTALLGARDDAERKALAKRIAELEKSADELSHDIVKRTRTSFVTPLDRDDLHRLTLALDDCINRMDDAADLIKLHRVGDPAGDRGSFSARWARQIDVLVRLAGLTQEAMPRLRTPADLSDYWIEVNRLENQAAKNHRRLVNETLDEHAHEPVTAFRLVLVAEALSAAVSAFERVAHTIEGIAVKEA